MGNCVSHHLWAKSWTVADEGTLYPFKFGDLRVKEMNTTFGWESSGIFLFWEVPVTLEAFLSHDNPSKQKWRHAAPWADGSEFTLSCVLSDSSAMWETVRCKEWLE